MQIKMDSIVTTRVLMVCLGNICRSPLAEGILQHLLIKHQLDHIVEVDSAGTSGLTGNAPDNRSISVAENHGIKLNHVARKLGRRDFERFDHILVMDLSNLENTLKLAVDENERAKVHLITKFDPRTPHPPVVVDPYWGTIREFEDVYHQLVHCCEGFIQHALLAPAPA